jgi:hypothetical protein
MLRLTGLIDWIIFSCILVLTSCQHTPVYQEQPSQQEFIQLTKKIQHLRDKYHLREAHFETDKVNSASDFQKLLQQIVLNILPEKQIEVTVTADSAKYTATLTSADTTMLLYAEANNPILPDSFFPAFEKIGNTFSRTLRLYSVNPVIGIIAQDAWYFCADETTLLQARKEGMPIIAPNENPFETTDFKRIRDFSKSLK